MCKEDEPARVAGAPADYLYLDETPDSAGTRLWTIGGSIASCSAMFIAQHCRPLYTMGKNLITKGQGEAAMVPRFPHMPKWQQLSPRVTVLNGLNPGLHTLQGTNTYLIGTGPSRILVDTGEGKEGYIDLLKEVMWEIGASHLSAILLTHWHRDHIGGVEEVKEAYGQKIPVYKREVASCKGKCKFEYKDIEDGQVFKAEGATLQALHTPGHTADHCAFILEEEKALLSGDMILGSGTAVFEDLTDYSKSLKRTLGFCRDRDLRQIFPGHGKMVEDAAEKCLSYLKVRGMRETQIIKALSHAETSDACSSIGVSSMLLTKWIYGGLPLPLIMSADVVLRQHLHKMEGEGRVAQGWIPNTWKLGDNAADSSDTPS
ncbi:unnamed protein product [Chrysoparadoxa australica]